MNGALKIVNLEKSNSSLPWRWLWNDDGGDHGIDTFGFNLSHTGPGWWWIKWWTGWDTWLDGVAYSRWRQHYSWLHQWISTGYCWSQASESTSLRPASSVYSAAEGSKLMVPKWSESAWGMHIYHWYLNWASQLGALFWRHASVKAPIWLVQGIDGRLPFPHTDMLPTRFLTCSEPSDPSWRKGPLAVRPMLTLHT